MSIRKEVIGDATLYCGDSVEVLRRLPDESVQCCVTSPPYYGLRSYLPDVVQVDSALSQSERDKIDHELAALGIYPINGVV